MKILEKERFDLSTSFTKIGLYINWYKEELIHPLYKTANAAMGML